MDDAAVPPGLVGREPPLLLDDRDDRAGAACQLEGRRHADDSAADDRHVAGDDPARHAQSHRFAPRAKARAARQAATTPGQAHCW